MGNRKFRLSCHRKNEERKKYRSRVTSLPASLDLSVPKSSLSSPIQSSSSPLVVSLPLSSYTDSTAQSIVQLLDRVMKIVLPPKWTNVTDSLHSIDHISLCKLLERPSCPARLLFTVTVTSTFQWTVHVASDKKSFQNELISSLPPALTSVSHVLQLLSLLDSAKVCPGNPEKKFLENVSHLHVDNSPAYIDRSLLEETVRSNSCQLLMPSSSTQMRCSSCARSRANLLRQLAWQAKGRHTR